MGTSQYLCSAVRIGVLAILAVSMIGCGVVRNAMYKTTGDVMVNFAEEHQVPFILGTDDVGMNCASSEALAPLLLSFGRVRDEPNKMAVMVYGAAGVCAEGAALDQELRYIRAIKNQNAMEAEDAMITQKRLNIVAAKRSYLAYQYLVKEYGETGGECPDLDNEIDEIVYMNGLLAGLLSLNNEIASTSGLGIPKNIAAKVGRSATCLDDDKWFGIPSALQATVWALLPGAQPEGEDAFKRLEIAVKKGEKGGVRVAHVLQATAAYGKGKDELVREVIKQHVKSKERRESNEQYLFLDELSTTMLTALSDKLWTQATGHRTPIGGLGTFWDEKAEPAGEVINLDDIL
ncbi:hypothetical protein [Allohahella marinimesophila]|uniref:Uncharacterized protein n=1 Tax=Allohahella marinimesophila TaxID=1054972 RepID=A0ABP7PF65_9GAMM